MLKNLLLGMAQNIRHVAKNVAQSIAEATAPQKRTLRLNPHAAFRPQRQPILTGPQLAMLRTQKRSGLSYRAARSKYAPAELKDAVARARVGRTLWLSETPRVGLLAELGTV